jgi:hypothetical protein
VRLGRVILRVEAVIPVAGVVPSHHLVVQDLPVPSLVTVVAVRVIQVEANQLPVRVTSVREGRLHLLAVVQTRVPVGLVISHPDIPVAAVILRSQVALFNLCQPLKKRRLMLVLRIRKQQPRRNPIRHQRALLLQLSPIPSQLLRFATWIITPG